MECFLTQKRTLILSVYVPNSAKEVFFKKMELQLEQYTYDQILMVKDFNGTMIILWKGRAKGR